MKKILFVLIPLIAIVLILTTSKFSINVKATNPNQCQHNEVRLCHYTEGGHYNNITVDDDAVFTQGHTTHQSGQDIIPPFDYYDYEVTGKVCPTNYTPSTITCPNECRKVSGNGPTCKNYEDVFSCVQHHYDGLNWPQQESIWNNGCKVPEVPTVTSTPTPTVTPSVTPTPTEIPILHHYSCNIDHQCVQVEGEGSDTCSPEDENSCIQLQFHNVCRENECVQVEGVGESSCKINEDCQETPPITPPINESGGTVLPPPDNEQHNYGPNQCTDSAPKTPIISWEGNPLPGCASFGLQQTDPFDTSTIMYGYSKTNLLYSLVDIPRSGDILKTPQIITVCGLTPHVNIWGQICTYRNFCGSCSEVIDPVLRH